MSITVITPVHGKYTKYAKMIEEIGQKLNEQTIKPHEWIIVCDKKSQWLKNLKLPSFTIVLVAEKNNISLKRNLALDNAKSEFIFLLDSDQIPESNELLSECIKKCSNDFDLIRIPEKFSNTGNYLKRCYHHLRGLYWTKNNEGIPRFVRSNLVKDLRFDPEMLHFEDKLFFEEIRIKNKEGVTENMIIHNEDFELYSNLRKVRIAHKQSKIHKIKPSFRLNPSIIIKETPISLLPGVVFILGLRTIAKRILPVESGTSR